MARIIVTFVQPPIDKNPSNLLCYYESFVKELEKHGNTLLVINKGVFAKKYFEPTTEYKEFLVQEIKKFNPELIIAFNNQVFDGLLENTSCPIVLFDADSSYLFSSKDLIPKYIDRYSMVTHYENWENSYNDFGFTPDKICSIHIATSLKKEEKVQDKNILFIGTKFLGAINPTIKTYIEKNGPMLYEMLKKQWNSGNFEYEELIREFCPTLIYNEFDIAQIFDYRNFVLSSVLDLGLNLYGVNWTKGEDNNLALMSAFDSTPKYSLTHNQELYNESKICLSISHPQTRGYAFPWRVYDIMATNGMLISSKSELLKKQTKDFVDIPMYESPYEARDLCKKYLKEENLRKEITAASNEFIEKHGRWDDNLKKLSEFLKIDLINTETQKASYVVLTLPPSIDSNIPSQKKKCFKGFRLALKFFLSQLPLITLIYPKKKKNKLYKQIGELIEHND